MTRAVRLAFVLLALAALPVAAQPITVPADSTLRGNADGTLTITPPPLPPAVLYPLTVTLSGSGQGTVALVPPGGVYAAGTAVAITATPAAGSLVGPASCVSPVTMSAAPLTCDQQFDLVPTPPDTTPPVISNIIESGVTATEALIQFETSESAATKVVWGTAVDTYPNETPWSALIPCTVALPCRVQLINLTPNTTYHYRVIARDAAGNEAPSADRTFQTAPPPTATLTVVTGGAGTGTVISQPAGIDCGSDCTEAYPVGTVVQLAPLYPEGNVFTGWSGACTGAGACTVTLDAATTVTALFDVAVPPDSGAGTWSQVGATCVNECWGQGYQGAAVDTARNEFVSMRAQGAGFFGIQLMPTVGPWRHWPDDNPATSPGTTTHNAGMAYDSLNDRVWIDTAGPQPRPGAFGWTPATRLFFKYAAAAPPPPSAVDAGTCFDPVTKAVYKIGGYSTNSNSVFRLLVDPFPTATAQELAIPGGPGFATNSQPTPTTGARITYTRTGCDLDGRRMWFVDDQMNLWFFYFDVLAWQRIPTAAGPRPSTSSVFAFSTTTRRIVGWAGTVQATGASIRQTWSIPIDGPTLQWVQGPSGGTGTPVASNEVSMVGFTHPDGRACFGISTGPFSVWCFLQSGTGLPPIITPPPTQQFSMLTTSTSGDGSLTGPLPSGPTVVGSDVTLPPAAAGSVVSAITPNPPCAQTFKMPATATACVVTVAKTTSPPVEPPIPPTGYPDITAIPPRTFVPVSAPPLTTYIDTTPWPADGGSKHQRWAADGQGHVWTGFGDTSPSRYPGNPSQGQGYRLNVATGQWTRWNPTCRPAGQLQPSWPDEVSWVRDPRGAFWLLGGVTQGTDGDKCNEEGGSATRYKTGLFKYTPATNLWERFTGVGGTNALYGHFDQRDQALMYIGGDNVSACGSALYKVNVDTLAQVRAFSACFSSKPFPGSPNGTFEDFVDMRVVPWAWDESTRMAYIVGYHNLKVASETAGQARHLWALNVDTGQITQLPDPPDPATNISRLADANSLVFDTKNKRVVWPAVTNHCGVIEKMLTYDVATRVWTEHPLTTLTAIPGGKVRANTAVYDPFHDVVVLGGSVACKDWGHPEVPEGITHYFLWRG